MSSLGGFLYMTVILIFLLKHIFFLMWIDLKVNLGK